MVQAEPSQDEISTDAAPLGGNRAEAVQRLQIGLSGIAAMILLVGLANVIQNRARENEQLAVPDAAPTTEPSVTAQQRDPLADAGVVPDLPVDGASPTPQPTAGGPGQNAQGERSGDAGQTP
ncbi:hypothetical protein [Altererythrobacter sp. GH1-8]|uniref:hypothetical protein n=1 Tax=Altererythrobacter sp. GH1-8 TaxID=3349333 RepID=UPI00374D36CA